MTGGRAPIGKQGFTPALAAAARRSLGYLESDGVNLYWQESRPDEGGRTTVCVLDAFGEIHDALPNNISSRSKVYEYGGKSYCVVGVRDKTGLSPIAFVDQGDQAVYVCDSGQSIQRVSSTPVAGETWSHGDLSYTKDKRSLTCIREICVGEVYERAIILFTLTEISECELIRSPGFCGAPRIIGGREKMCWISWNHPEMQWMNSTLWIATIKPDSNAYSLKNPIQVESKEILGRPVSVSQPIWITATELVFLSDRNGWWQPWKWTDHQPLEQLTAIEADHHHPDWVFGQSTYAIRNNETFAIRKSGQSDQLVRLNGFEEKVVQTKPCATLNSVCIHGNGLAWIGGRPDQPTAIYVLTNLDALDDGITKPMAYERTSFHKTESQESNYRCFDFPTIGTVSCFGILYLPESDQQTSSSELPPLILTCHGGPTSQAIASFDPLVLLLLDQGYAVAAINYRGSSGFGRKYRNALNGLWGIADVEDCCRGAEWLGKMGIVDSSRMAIRGSSAGGLTALGSLVNSDIFCGGVSWYGVSTLEALVEVTHDFESHYTDSLVGVLPNDRETFIARSPVHHASKIQCPVLILQGELDQVVPISQAESMVEVLRENNVRCTYHVFEKDGHGFRSADSLERAYQLELDFYATIF